MSESYFTLADADRLPSANADQVISESNFSVIIDGDLTTDGLTTFLRSPDIGRTIQKKFCIRFNAQELSKIGDVPHQSNRFCDVSAGETSEGLTLVLESHRCYTADSQGNASALKRFYRHAFICSDLSHTNIVPFLGVFCSNKFPYACVFESVGKENILNYLASRPDTSRPKLLVEVARGLQHIHDLNIVHGNIRGANIRIDEQGVARIAEFSSATIILERDIAFEDIDESAESNVSRWCSPEILHPGGFGLTKEKVTKASDMYAFGMLAYEIFSGRAPFHERTDVAIAATVIITDERPSRPTHQQLSDQLWEIIEKCWCRDPSQRPTILEVVTFLERSNRPQR